MAIPFFRIPRLGVSAHLTALMNAFVLMTLAVTWEHVRKHRPSKWIRGLFLFCAYTMTIGGIFGAAWGTSWFTPMASAGAPPAAVWQQVVIAVLVIVTVLTYIVATAFVVWILRPRPQTE